MQNVCYDFSSCHVDVPQPLANEIVKWGRAEIDDDDLYVTQHDPTFGREDEIHITILYGLHAEQPDQIRAILEHTGPVRVKLGKTDVFTNPHKFDVVMIEVESEDLAYLNDLLQQHVKFTNRHPIYSPHVTIAYVKKGRGWKHREVAKWEGREFVCNYAVFSSKNGSKERIVL
jgi:2'-5' RNA ligase